MHAGAKGREKAGCDVENDHCKMQFVMAHKNSLDKPLSSSVKH